KEQENQGKLKKLGQEHEQEQEARARARGKEELEEARNHRKSKV
ncbi:hypothetical protein A2U01_0109631, partial [Trifolium medium]|nr:hypothetical protein [Trifolium medium]